MFATKRLSYFFVICAMAMIPISLYEGGSDLSMNAWGFIILAYATRFAAEANQKNQELQDAVSRLIVAKDLEDRAHPREWGDPKVDGSEEKSALGFMLGKWDGKH